MTTAFDKFEHAVKSLPAKHSQDIDLTTSLYKSMVIDQEQIDNHTPPEDDAHIKPATDFHDAVIDSYEEREKEHAGLLPWAKTHSKVEIRPGELSLWAGYNGHKKSLITGQAIYHLINQGHTAVIASLEMHPVVTLKRMAAQAIGNTRPTEEYLNKFFTSVSKKLFLFDQQNSVPTERVLKMARYCSEKLGLNHIVIDSLMKSGMATDDYNAQKNFAGELAAIGKYNGTHMHLVCHMRKPPRDTKYMPDRYDIAGGSDISNQADNIFIVWSDMERKAEAQKPLELQNQQIMIRPAIKFGVEKQRNGEFEGRFALGFCERSLQAIQDRRIDYL